jgi:hypothetical protein
MHATAQADAVPAVAAPPLPELAAVHWRARVDERALVRSGRLWTATTVAHTVPFIAAAGVLMVLQPLAFAVALVALAHAWVIPALYALRGANVVRPKSTPGAASPGGSAPEAERVAAGLLGDLVGHRARDLYADTGLVLERGRLGVWLVGPTGALLVRGRRVFCYCVKVDPRGGGDEARALRLPQADRIAHLLLALRADESGFATVANLGFSGAAWRVARRLPPRTRAAIAAARRCA